MMRDENENKAGFMTDGPGMAYNPNAPKSPMSAMQDGLSLGMMAFQTMQNAKEEKPEEAKNQISNM